MNEPATLEKKDYMIGDFVEKRGQIVFVPNEYGKWYIQRLYNWTHVVEMPLPKNKKL